MHEARLSTSYIILHAFCTLPHICLLRIDEFDLPKGIVDREVKKMTMISPTNKEVQIGQTLKDDESLGFQA